ncbi:SDR family NAD(P)-dependent oxidoreductase [Rhizobium sp. 'Codium 1']|uniref:SDR family NAD(P)-dependent oxidoreductase n=1 Tax=Rhizobium sp. 'Codium 1' TaxID=2940484 RepID=UPI001E5CE247|nr:SDR family oxidoreductase [Rhizobium sp. 'Codium 1']MCC8933833.1 SDR family oxidoreductase [Rhizobium sp. 'Codium 1']
MSSTLGTALVTGASSGIGATYARKLAERGHDLLLVARDEERLAALAAELKDGHGIAADILKADLTLPADVKRVEERLRADQAISVLVNNAGIGPNGVLLDGDIDYLDRMIAINVTAANRLAVAAAQAFAQRGRGTIINIASVVALAPEIFNGTYSASKAFILALTQSLAHELRETPVRIQAVLPGLTRTEIFDRVGSSFDHIDPERVMDVEDLVRSAVVGLDQGELVTVPSLEDASLLAQFGAARQNLGPHLSKRVPASRYMAKA